MTLSTASIRLESDDFSCQSLTLHRLDGREELSRPFELHADVVSWDAFVPAADEMIGAGVRVVWSLDGDDVRTLHGVVVALRDGLQDNRVDGGRPYRLTIAPRAFRMSLVETQEVFLECSIPDILRKKLSMIGFTEGEDFELRLNGAYPRLEFVVQYKESDLAFVQRLAENAGIAFHFDHEGGTDKMVFSDSNAALAPARVPPAHRFDPRGALCIASLETNYRVVPCVFGIQDYNYRTPLVPIVGQHEVNGYFGGVLEYGTHAKTPAEAAGIARIRAEERCVERQVFEGTSGVVGLGAGGRFTLVDHPLLAFQPELLLLSVEHEYRGAEAGGSESAVYKNRFRAIATTVTYRPPRRTPKPKIHGFLTGIVEALHATQESAHPSMDEEGRYWIRLHCDTADPNEQRASRPIRMTQTHAGAGFGSHFPILPGTEVVMAFLDGDPDRPIIFGAVPNAATPSPVVRNNALESRVVTASGVVLCIRDA